MDRRDVRRSYGFNRDDVVFDSVFVFDERARSGVDERSQPYGAGSRDHRAERDHLQPRRDVRYVAGQAKGDGRDEAQRGAAMRGEVQRCAAMRGEAQRGAARCSEVQRGAARRSEAQRGATRRNEARRGGLTARCSEVQRGAVRRSEAQRGAARRGEAQRGAWRGAVRCSEVQRGAARCSEAQRGICMCARRECVRAPCTLYASQGIMCVLSFLRRRAGVAARRRPGCVDSASPAGQRTA